MTVIKYIFRQRAGRNLTIAYRAMRCRIVMVSCAMPMAARDCHGRAR